jgi:hypothetical protein
MDGADAASVGRYLSPRLCRRQTIRHAEAMLLTTNGYSITSKRVPKRNRSTRGGRGVVRREKVRIRIRIRIRSTRTDCAPNDSTGYDATNYRSGAPAPPGFCAA